jgi:RNA polymerase sigma-70 factor (ECF subfamily)
MVPPASGEITVLLQATRGGNAGALDRLLSLVYPQLRALAAHLLRTERANHTLQPTALVNEAVVKLFLRDGPDMRDHAHLMALAGRQMRRILIDFARARLSARRGDGEESLDLHEASGSVLHDLDTILTLDTMLEQLRREDPRAAEIVELRFYAGFSVEEIAMQLGITTRTVQRDWEFARAWLYDALDGR